MTARPIRVCLAAFTITGAAAMLTACADNGQASTGWRFGPAERPPRASRAAARADTTDTADLASADPASADPAPAGLVNAGEPGDVGVVAQAEPAPAPRSNTTDRAPQRAAADAIDRAAPMSSVEKTALRERALALLTDVASSGSPEERANALEALARTPTRLTGLLEPALRSESSGLRSVAASVVGRARVRGVEELLRPLTRDTSPFVRASALFALKRTDAQADLTPLADMLLDTDPRVRAHAAFTLGEIGDRSALGLLREAAASTMPRATPAAVRLMDLQIAEARVKLGDDEALADLRAALFPARPEDLEAAALAAQIVGEVRDMGSVSQLINLTQPAPDGGGAMPAEIRLAAAAALAKLDRQPRNAAGLAREYINNPGEAIRAQAALVMGYSKEQRMLTPLADLLGDSSGRVRVAAAAAIVRLTAR